MFRHRGKGRTYSHNLRLASILSCVAGIVNVVGVLAIKILTTNVTGHFAYFAEELFLENYKIAAVYLCFIIFFLLGAFVSGFLIEFVSKYYKPRISYVLPIFIETSILFAIGCSDFFIHDRGSYYFSVILACALLFSMGLQNALVTNVSQSVVRTTHLTGLFTDLGIELSQLIFHKKTERARLNKNIFLKLMIITFFFLGVVMGGFLFQSFELKTLFLSVTLLCFALWYDRLLSRYYYLRRRLRHYH